MGRDVEDLDGKFDKWKKNFFFLSTNFSLAVEV